MPTITTGKTSTMSSPQVHPTTVGHPSNHTRPSNPSNGESATTRRMSTEARAIVVYCKDHPDVASQMLPLADRYETLGRSASATFSSAQRKLLLSAFIEMAERLDLDAEIAFLVNWRAADSDIGPNEEDEKKTRVHVLHMSESAMAHLLETCALQHHPDIRHEHKPQGSD